MKYYILTLTLLDDVVISQRAASMGGHRSLDYIPGATLLGACAAKLYSTLSLIDAFSVFHSGKIRFCNAYPLSDTGESSRPAPNVWFYPKASRYKTELGDRCQLNSKTLIHASAREDEGNKGKQYVQLRAGYVTNELEVLSPIQTLRMKTAINPETARAATSQLFGYQALQAGQVFQAVIQFDDDVLDLAKKISPIMQGQILIGRSRSAQYGRIDCHISTLQTDAIAPPAETTQLQLWLQSDMALQDEQGQALMQGKEANLPGFSDSIIDWDNSHLRFRRYSPYNGKRRSYDMERQVIEKGSVLAMNLDEPLNQAQWQLLQSGLGLYRESGLGQVLVNSPLLNPESWVNIKPLTSNPQEIATTVKPDTPLANWLDKKTQGQAKVYADKHHAEQLISVLHKLYKNARTYAGIEAHIPIGPSASQWALIVEAGKLHQRDKQIFMRVVFDPEKGICDSKDEGWNTMTKQEHGKLMSFSTWLQNELNSSELNSCGYVATLVAKAGAEMVKAHKGERYDT